jgi:hypothetical protein
LVKIFIRSWYFWSDLNWQCWLLTFSLGPMWSSPRYFRVRCLFLSCFSSKWQTSEEPTPVWPGSTFLGVKNWSFYIYLGPCGAHQASKISICKHSLHKNSTFL